MHGYIRADRHYKLLGACPVQGQIAHPHMLHILSAVALGPASGMHSLSCVNTPIVQSLGLHRVCTDCKGLCGAS